MKRLMDRVPRALVVALVAGLTQGTWVVRASAQQDAEPVRLSYQAAEGCPDESSFVARIRARSPRARVAWPGEPAREFSVTLSGGPRPTGSVTVTAVDQTEGTRRVRAGTCAEVADALALVIALATDPRASAPAAPPSTPPALSEPTPPPAAAAPPAEGAARALTVPNVSEAAPARAGSKGVLSVGADFAVTEGVVPVALLGASPYVSWRGRRLGTTVVEPSVRLAFVRAASGTVRASTGTAAFEWTVGRVDGCPIAWPGGDLRLAACARLEAGALQATAGDIDLPETRVRPWLAAGAVARVEWSPLSAMFLDAEVGGLVRATTDRFVFLPETTVYQVPVLGLSTGVGLGVEFL